MKHVLIFLSMLFCHNLADYNLQGWLASAKRYDWWIDNAPDPIYRHDYIMALFEHAFSWAFMIYLPIIVIYLHDDIAMPACKFVVSFACNVAFHAFIDDAKANGKVINLVEDQLLHFLQIAFTAIFFFI